MPTKKLKFIDLFSGAGGFSCGLEKAGLECLLGVDFDKYAIETFQKNHPTSNSFCGDITQISQRKLQTLLQGEAIDIVVGGPPCQGFSTVGRGNPFDDRNKLFLHFLKIVKWSQPKFVVMENVTGLVAKKNEKTLKEIVKRFNRLGYALEVQVLEAHKYGVPERRKRTIFIATKVQTPILFPKQITDIEKDGRYIAPPLVGDAFKEINKSKKWVQNHDLETAQLRNSIDRIRLSHIPEGAGIRYAEDEQQYLPKKYRLGVNWDELPENRFRQTKYQRLHRKKVSPTIMTHRQNYYHPTQDRYLTPREAASLQSFPLDFNFAGPLSAQWRQIGNAVPPELAFHIGKSLKKMHSLSLKSSKTNQKREKASILKIRETAFSY